VSAFIVPGDTAGLSGGKKEKKLGIRCSHTGEVLLDDVMSCAFQWKTGSARREAGSNWL
jgi:alkylation response protein AidB-like acyl-CoA dehydrogenase